MAIEDVFEHYRESGREVPNGVDVVGILRSGTGVAKTVWQRLESISGTPDVRKILLYPKPEYRTPLTPTAFKGWNAQSKDTMWFEMMVEEGLLPQDTSKEDYWSQPSLRFMEPNREALASPEPGNIVILADDVIYNGRTMKKSIEDLENLGYPRSNIYYCSIASEEGVWSAGDNKPEQSYPNNPITKLIADTPQKKLTMY